MTMQIDSPLVQVGGKIRRLRLSKNLTLEGLGQVSGVSRSLISEVELGRGNPSVMAIYNIAHALGVSVQELVGEPGESETMVRANERRRIVYPGTQVEHEMLTPGRGHALQGVVITLPPHMPIGEGRFSHPGEEMAYVLSGEVEFYLEDRCYRLRTGDCLIFPSSTPHDVANPTGQPSVVLSVNTPPSF